MQNNFLLDFTIIMIRGFFGGIPGNFLLWLHSIVLLAPCLLPAPALYPVSLILCSQMQNLCNYLFPYEVCYILISQFQWHDFYVVKSIQSYLLLVVYNAFNHQQALEYESVIVTLKIFNIYPETFTCQLISSFFI